MGTVEMGARKKRRPALSHHLRPACMTTGRAGAQRCKRRNLCVITAKKPFRHEAVPLQLDIAAPAMVPTVQTWIGSALAAAPRRIRGARKGGACGQITMDWR